MAKQEPIHIVGAGLSGLTAAINLADAGREVIVLEKGRRVGGLSFYNPSPHGTPMDVDRMTAYTGIDLRPGLVPLPGGTFSVWGKRHYIKFKRSAPAWMIERGPRRSSMDHYLYRLAREKGVRFEFDHPVLTDRQVHDLPRGSIMATGLHMDGFEASGVPYQLLYGCMAKCRVPWQEARVTVYFDDYSPDYAFTCSVNGIAFALIFNRHRPVAKWEMEKFAEQAVELDGYPFKKFLVMGEGAAPTRSITNPRLFHGDLILAGTLAGMMDPILFFGMHGAFISGKIAARAVTDRVGAFREFKRINRTFYPVLLGKRLVDHLPRACVKYPIQAGLSVVPAKRLYAPRQAFIANVSGYSRI